MSDLRANKVRLLELMLDGKWHHMRDMERAGGMRYGGRLFELHKDGWQYEKRTVGPNEWEYKLVVEPRQMVMEGV